MFQIGKSLEKLAGEPQTIYVNGGLARSPVWVQVLADVFGKEVRLSESHHSAAWGAAWTALVGAGKAESFAEIKRNIAVGAVIAPNRQVHETYAKIYEKYERLANDLSVYFD